MKERRPKDMTIAELEALPTENWKTKSWVDPDTGITHIGPVIVSAEDGHIMKDDILGFTDTKGEFWQIRPRWSGDGWYKTRLLG